jgi:hypothetical protein
MGFLGLLLRAGDYFFGGIFLRGNFWEGIFLSGFNIEQVSIGEL